MMAFGIAMTVCLAVLIWIFVRAWRRQALTHTWVRIEWSTQPFRYAVGIIRLACAAIFIAILFCLGMTSTRDHANSLAATALVSVLALMLFSVPLEGLVSGRFTFKNHDCIRADEPVRFWFILTFSGVVAGALLLLAVFGAKDLIS